MHRSSKALDQNRQHSLGLHAIIRTAFLACALLPMDACAILDDQITSRSDILKDATDNAKNNWILVNIIRASHSQPLNFLAISKATGGQTTDFKVGLPNVTFGPGQTVAQKQYTFSGSTWDNSASMSFDSAPLVTHDFYNDMLTPVPLQVMAAFIHQGFSRELVFNALINSIRVDGLNPPLELTKRPTRRVGLTRVRTGRPILWRRRREEPRQPVQPGC